jgi:hypothetical protein
MGLASAGLFAAQKHKSVPAERSQVRANSVLGERQLFGQLSNGPGAAAQKLHDLAPSGLKEIFARCACRHMPFPELPLCRRTKSRVVFVKPAINTTKCGLIRLARNDSCEQHNAVH